MAISVMHRKSTRGRQLQLGMNEPGASSSGARLPLEGNSRLPREGNSRLPLEGTAASRWRETAAVLPPCCRRAAATWVARQLLPLPPQ